MRQAVEFWKEIKKLWTDQDGIVLPKLDTPNPSETGNSVYTWIFYYLWNNLPKGTFHDMEGRYVYRQFAEKIQVVGYPGLLNRTPYKGQNDRNAHDDYVSYCLASKNLCGGIQAKQVVQHGIRRKFFWLRWHYNNQNPGKFIRNSWFGRMPWIPAHMMICAGIRINLYRRVAWAAKIAYNGIFKGKGATSWFLTWCMVRANDKPSWLCKKAIKLWHKGLVRNYPQGMNDVFKEHMEEDHPFNSYPFSEVK